MAETKHSAAQAHEPQARGELMISLRPFGWHMWKIEGARAQLEAEGLVPPGVEWPETGARIVNWTAGPLQFHLKRTRLADLKGPKRLWVDGDWWALRCEPLNFKNVWEQRLIDAQRDLERARRDQTPAGQSALFEQFSRGCAADRDPAFQAFKALIPGLIPPRRGRRADAG